MKQVSETPTAPNPLDTLAEQRDALPVEELRLALVLNGGVSLAVWMGGVAHEIDRLTRSEAPRAPVQRSDGVSGHRGTAATTASQGYGAILGAARTSVVVDVISGTSAGGINGAALALAQANKRADLRALRTLWSEHGRMEELLRRPFRGSPTSMLRGDDYFLPELQRAMQMLARPFEPPDKPPQIDLTLTTTLLKGGQDVTVDDFGERIPQRIHAGTFNFSNVGRDGRPPASQDDVFGRDNLSETARALALAARCTASFPFAFEPSFVPVGEDGDDHRPDMRAYASWAKDDGAVHSRYTVDGGLLANTPLSHALDAIARRHADGPVRRAMLMVFPHAPQAEEVESDVEACPPTTAGSIGGVLGALLAQGSRSFVERVDEHNRAAAEWQGSREQILDGLGSQEPVASLYSVLREAWPHYRHIRIRYAARGLADKVTKAEQWSYERRREAAESAQRRWAAARGGRLPYVPTAFLTDEAPRREDGLAASRAWQEEYLDRAKGWQWGDSAAAGVADASAAVLRAALSIAPQRDAETFGRARERLGSLAAEIEETRHDLDRIWQTNPYLSGLEPNESYWEARIIAYQRAMQPRGEDDRRSDDMRLAVLLPPQGDKAAEREAAIKHIVDRTGEHGQRIWSAVTEVVTQIADLRDQLERTAALNVGEQFGLRRWTHALFAPMYDEEPERQVERMLLRLLAVDAGTRLLADGTPVGGNLPVSLAELSLRVEHPWARFSVTPDDKAAGLELARFGGFLKRSWRMNDWTWGRLDAVTMLCQVVLDPRRLRRIAAMLGRTDDPALATEMFELLKRELYAGAEIPAQHADLERSARLNLREGLDPSLDLRHLPVLAKWAALPFQAEIILEELPVLAASVKVDRDEGAGTPTRGTRFLLDQEMLLERIGLPAATADEAAATKRLELGVESLRAFDSAGIGRERLTEETGSDALIRTASTAASVLATVMDADASRSAPAIRPVTSAVRGAVMLPHWIVTGLASSGTIARFLATAGLVIGGLLLTLSLLGVLGSLGSAAGLVGAATLLAALGYSALKTGSLLHACALLAPVVPLMAFALDASGDDVDGSGAEAANRVLLVVAAVVALYVLANIPWPLYSPLENLRRGSRRLLVAVRRLGVWLTRRHRGVLVAVATGAAVAVGALVWGPTAETMRGWMDRLTSDSGVAVAFATLFTVGAAIAYRQGVNLRAWRSDPQVEVTFGPTRTLRGSFERKRVAHPSGVAASWSPVYGLGYLALAWLLLTQGWSDPGSERWQLISFWWLTAVGSLLCVVAPLYAGHGARRGIEAVIRRRWSERVHDRRFLPVDAAPSLELVYMLLKYDTPYAYLLRPPVAWWQRLTGGVSTSDELELTAAGRRLLQDLPTRLPKAPLSADRAGAGRRSPGAVWERRRGTTSS